MKSLSSIPTSAQLFRAGFFPTALCASIAAALLLAPTLTNAQNSHKPTRFHPKPRVDDTAPPQAEPETVITDGAAAIEPHSGPAISSFLNTTTFTVPTTPVWTALGPAPIPNGQTIPADVNGVSLTQSPVSGRVTSVAIDPANANIVYVGAAQGGVYKSTNGGSTWTPLMDSAMTLAVGSLELDPTDATGNTLLVGSGESNFSGDSYAGFGVYKVTALKSSPVLSGPFNQSTAATDVFSKRGIPGLAIDPNNHDIVYVGTATAQQGIGPQPFTGAPARGLYRSTNFFSGASTFTKLSVGKIPAGADFRVTSIVYEPGNSDRMFVGIADASGAHNPQYIGGIYFTSNAGAPTPTFTRILETQVRSFSPIKFAINKIGTTVTVVAVTGETAPNKSGQGKAYKAVYDSSKPINPTF